MDFKQHLLCEDNDACIDEAKDHLQDAFDKHRYHSCRKSWLRCYRPELHLWTYIYFLILHLALAATLIILTKNTGLSAFRKHIDVGSYSPILEAIEYEGRQEYATSHVEYSVYSGPPSSEQDKAWDRLVRPIFFSVSRKELAAVGESWEDTADLVEGGYLASLGVYHKVHYLRRLRLFLYKERYYTNLTEDQYSYLTEHLDHCIETIRLTVMCKANTGVYSFAWDNPPKEKPATRINSKRTCVNWNALEEWSYSRMVPRAPRLNSPVTADDEQNV